MYDGPHQIKHFENLFLKSKMPQEKFVLRDRWYKEDDGYGLMLTNRAGVLEYGNQNTPENQTNKCLELYEIFRNEYDRRIDDYLCGRGITDEIPWFDHKFFEEADTANLGDKKCNKLINEGFSHYKECKDKDIDELCKSDPENKCC